jgi:phosphate transport system substrate-binding protein
MKWAFVGLTAGALLLGSGMASAAERVTLTGSSTIAPVMSEIAKRYEKLHPEVRIDVQTGGSSRGINDVRQGLADIGMASRALKPEESDVTPITLAYDGVGFMVHADNPIAELTAAQIVDIYTGKTTTWSALGGPDKKIDVTSRAEGRSELELFLEHFKLKSDQIKADQIAGETEHAIKVVAGDPNAIGYGSIGAAEYSVGKGVPIKLLPLDGIPASRETVAGRTFPIVRPLNLVLTKEPTGLVKDFIAFATSEDVRDIIESFYYIPPKKPGT